MATRRPATLWTRSPQVSGHSSSAIIRCHKVQATSTNEMSEIRAQILHVLLARKLGIVPLPLRRQLHPHKKEFYTDADGEVMVNVYLWDDCRGSGTDNRSMPDTDSRWPQTIQVAWRSEPTPKRQAIIKTGNLQFTTEYNEMKLPSFTLDSSLYAWVDHFVLSRGEFSTQILNRAATTRTGLEVNVLRGCQKLTE